MTKECGSIVSLKTYIDTRLDDLTKATDLAADNLKIRLDSLNEWRAQNKDERDQFTTRLEHNFLTKQVEDLKDSINKRPTWLMTFIFLIMSFLFGLLVTHFLT